jgi:type I restriction enzyme S subunit
VSRIDDLLREHCPEGVAVKPLGEVGTFIRGNGLQRKDFVDEGVGCIHYGQIYTHYGTSATETKSFVTPELAAKLRSAQPGDLVVTTTSENVEDVGKAVAWIGEGPIAIGGHSCSFAHSLDPLYVAYYFQTDAFHRQKRRFVKGTKVKELSTQDLARIEIPVPAIAIQREIVAILTRMEALEAELEAELEARRRQYAHYRDALLSFDSLSLSLSLSTSRVRWLTVGELGVVFGGLTGKSKQDFSDGNARYVSYLNVFNNLAVDTAAQDYVTIHAGERQRRLHAGDILLTGSSESAAEVAMSSVVVNEPAGPLYLNSFCMAIRPDKGVGLDPDFAKHLFRSAPMRKELVRTASGVTRFNVSKERLRKVRVPIPDAGSQARIVAVLDRFESLVNDITIGLPAELVARRTQYEYYRDRLFAFERLAA